MSYNMEYCKFENTAGALSECIEHWDDVDDAELSSDRERKGKARIIKMVKQLYEDLDLGEE